MWKLRLRFFKMRLQRIFNRKWLPTFYYKVPGRPIKCNRLKDWAKITLRHHLVLRVWPLAQEYRKPTFSNKDFPRIKDQTIHISNVPTIPQVSLGKNGQKICNTPTACQEKAPKPERVKF